MADSNEMTLDDAVDLMEFWLVHLRGAGKSPQTLIAYERGARQYLEFCREQGHPPIVRRSLSAWLASLRDRGLQGYTARTRLTAVRSFAKWLADEGEIDVSPFVGMNQPVVDEKMVQPLTDEQITAMIAACKTGPRPGPEQTYLGVRDAALIHVLAESAIRSGELLALLVDDVRWKDTPPTLIVRKTKTRRGRTVPLSPQAADRLARYVRERRKLRDSGLDEFWLSARGGPLRYGGFYDALVKRAESAGVKDWHPHRMRHTGAHRWLAAGGSEGGLMAVAGWQSPSMLNRYTRAQAGARAAEEAKRLNLGEGL